MKLRKLRDARNAREEDLYVKVLSVRRTFEDGDPSNRREEVEAEAFLRVEPRPLQREAAVAGQLRELIAVVLV
jgi:hypothetical protein